MMFTEGKFLPRVCYTGLEMAFGALGALGTGMNAAGTIMGGNASSSALRAQAPVDALTAMYAATELRNKGNEALAGSQRQAMAQDAQKVATESTLRARAAADGGSATDTTAVNLGGQIENQGEFNKLMSLYGGEARKAAYDTAATNAAIGGVNKVNADMFKADTIDATTPLQAGGTLMSGFSSLYDKYGRLAKQTVG